MKYHFVKQVKSFSYAFSGLFSVLNSEGHMRFHLIMCIYVIAFVWKFYDFTTTQWAVLMLTVASVLVLEILNTAFERICDTITKEYNENIKYVKDIAAGAVLITAIVAVAVGIFLLYDVEVFKSMYNYFFVTDVWAFVVLLVSIAVSMVFILIKPECYLGFLKKK